MPRYVFDTNAIVSALLCNDSMPGRALMQACRDPKDDKILELAYNGNAVCIVTGDNDLLVMNPFRGVAIIKPAEFLMVVGSGGGAI